MFYENRVWMSGVFVGMLDLHEIFRLHGQVIGTSGPDGARRSLSRGRPQMPRLSFQIFFICF